MTEEQDEEAASQTAFKDMVNIDIELRSQEFNQEYQSDEEDVSDEDEED